MFSGHGAAPRSPFGTSPFLPFALDVIRREERLARLRRTDAQSRRDFLLLVRGLDEIVRRTGHPSSPRFAASKGGRRPTCVRRGTPGVQGNARNQVALQVVELELRGLADQVGRALLVVDAGQLDDDLVAALLADLRLGDADACRLGRRMIVTARRDPPRRPSRPSRARPSGPLRGRPGGRGRASASSARGDPGSASTATPTRAAIMRPIRMR